MCNGVEFDGSPPSPWDIAYCRSCGIWLRLLGSPPPPWGHFTQFEQARACVRFTPMPMRTFSKGARRSFVWTVHPHARGGHCNQLARAAEMTRFTPTPVGTLARLHVAP
jgi:hypothetical protein